jgi:hypothetical protein
MNQLVKDMRGIYRIRHYDFMGYTFRTLNDLSYHHILKECDGGLKTLDNGALLVKDTAHPYLHLIEERDYDMYVYINKILKSINSQHDSPTKAQLEAIREVLLEFEEEHKNDINSKGRKLIKQEYLDRRIDLW